MSDVISRSALISRFAYYHAHSYGKAEYAYGVAAEEVLNAPTVDAVPVVRCKDCKHARPLSYEGYVACILWSRASNLDGFCHKGAKMDGGSE